MYCTCLPICDDNQRGGRHHHFERALRGLDAQQEGNRCRSSNETMVVVPHLLAEGRQGVELESAALLPFLLPTPNLWAGERESVGCSLTLSDLQTENLYFFFSYVFGSSCPVILQLINF